MTTFLDPLLKDSMTEKEYAFNKVGDPTNSGVQRVEVESSSSSELTESSASKGSVEQTPAPSPSPAQQPVAESQGMPSMSWLDDEEDEDFEQSNDDPSNPNGGGNPDQNNLNIPDETASQSAEMMADFVLDLYQNQLPKLLHSTSKVPTQNLKVAETIGKIGVGTTEIVDNLNDANQKRFKISNEDRKSLKRPLVEVLTVNGMSMSPTSALVMALVISLGSLVFTWKQVKDENKALIDQILDKVKLK